MPNEKFETVRKVGAAMNARDTAGYLACCTSDVELVPITAAIEGTYTGARGIERFFDELRKTAPDIQVEVEHLQAVGGDVLAFERAWASGRASGVSGDFELTTLYEFADNSIRRIRTFLDRPQAFEAAGMQCGD